MVQIFNVRIYKKFNAFKNSRQSPLGQLFLQNFLLSLPFKGPLDLA